jgi:hypothetical protein
MMKYLTKFTVDILPSVAATVIGAYIVNHYIVSKPAANAPAAAAVSTAEPKADAKPGEKPAQVSNLPEAGVKAKGISERALLERSASEKGAVIEKAQEKSVDQKPAASKPADAKPAEPSAETASAPAEPRRHAAPAPREKAVAKLAPTPAQPAAPAVAPVTPTLSASPSVEAVIAPEERRDANDLARAAIERLRGTSDSAQRPQEAARASEVPRAPEVARVPEAPRVVTAPSLRPLPPPIMVSTPPSESPDQSAQPSPPYAASARIDDPQRPTPPAEIPVSRAPLDLRADAAGPPAKEHTTVADDMLSAAKSVFHAVLPKSSGNSEGN